jgi:hypothetical protein
MSARALVTAAEYWKHRTATFADRSTTEAMLATAPTASMVILTILLLISVVDVVSCLQVGTQYERAARHGFAGKVRLTGHHEAYDLMVGGPNCGFSFHSAAIA